MYAVYAAAVMTLSVLTALHILLNTRDESERTVLWLLVIFGFPVFGVILYLFCGLNRRNTMGRRVDMILDAIRKKNGNGMLNFRKRALTPFIAGRTETANMEYRNMMDRIFPDYPPLNGNDVQLLCDGTAAYPEMLKSIREAKHSIHLESYIFADDTVSRQLFEELRKKAQEGVQVKVIYDSLGSLPALISHFFRRYSHRSGNLKICAFSRTTLLTPWRNQLRNHRKLLITDGTTAFLGGLNISAGNVSGKESIRIHDLHCRIQGTAVSELQFVFLQDWNVASGDAPGSIFREEYFPVPRFRGNTGLRVIPSGHGYVFQGTEQTFFAAVSTARKSVWICTPYFVPERAFSKALRTAALRGVDVRIIMPEKNNHFFMQLASENLYPTLCADGVRIFARKGAFSHTKAMLCDGTHAYFGSSNCDVRSFRLNYELDVSVTSGSFLQELHEQFLQELENSSEITLEDTRLVHPVRRLAQSICALFTPVL